MYTCSSGSLFSHAARGARFKTAYARRDARQAAIDFFSGLDRVFFLGGFSLLLSLLFAVSGIVLLGRLPGCGQRFLRSTSGRCLFRRSALLLRSLLSCLVPLLPDRARFLGRALRGRNKRAIPGNAGLLHAPLPKSERLLATPFECLLPFVLYAYPRRQG